MKHVFADEQRDAAVATVERLYALAARKVALLVKHAVGGQVHFAMHAEHAARFEKHARVIETVVAGFLDQAHHQRNVLGQLGEFGHGLARALKGNVGHCVLEPIAGQAELGEHQYVDTLFQGLGNKFFVSFEVGLEVAENRRKLSNCDTRPATGPPYGIFHCLFSRAVAFTAPAAGPLSAFRYQWGSSPLFWWPGDAFFCAGLPWSTLVHAGSRPAAFALCLARLLPECCPVTCRGSAGVRYSLVIVD